MLQSTFFDPVLGLDIHVVGIPAPPAPAPVPTPVPMPFIGMVFDPLGLAIGAAIGLATGGGPGFVLVNSLPVTNCGTVVTNLLTMPHLPAPGVTFIPPPKPSNDAMLMFGSLNVSIAGTYGVRLGDIALSCSDPVRLPTSVVLAIPKGRLVLNNPPMVLDVAGAAAALAMHGLLKGLGALARRGAALFRRLRSGSGFFGRLSQKLGGCFAPAGAGRWRQMWSRAVRAVTGHPVDVVTGNLFTSEIDAELPGPLPLVIERVYESAGSGKAGALGHGWSHSLDESLWMERGRAVVRCGDGREIEFPLWELPERAMRRGDVVERVIHKMKLRCAAPGHFELEHEDGRIHEFAAVAGGDPAVLRLLRIRSRDGQHAIFLGYDHQGWLDTVTDSARRVIKLDHDERGRLVALQLPLPDREGWYTHRQYSYGPDGDLVAVEDAEGHAWRHQYQRHLLVQETDRTGYSFYFQYDGMGAAARCVRTWGDGGRYDHVINYDQPNRKTVVEDSLGAVTVYSFNVRNQVVAVTNGLGQTTKFDFDPDTGGQTLEENPLGARVERRFDSAGSLIEVTAPAGAKSRIEYQGRDLVRAIDARGGEWRWRYDSAGHLVESAAPDTAPVTFGWERGLVTWRAEASGGRTSFEYDERKMMAAVKAPDGGRSTFELDNQGRVVELRNALGGATSMVYDREGRIVETQNPATATQRLAYDAEGNLLEVTDGRKSMRLTHVGRRIVRRQDGSATADFEWDTEGRLVGVVNQNGERFGVELDVAGRARAETGFDGGRRVYQRDAVGRVTKLLLPSGRATESSYDPGGRLLEARHSDGTFVRFEYDPGGLVTAAENESGRVELEYDAGWRVVAEHAGGHTVRSAYGRGGDRVEMTSSLGNRVLVERGDSGQPVGLYLGRPSSAGRAPDVTFEIDQLGMERACRYENGVSLLWDRDVAGRTATRRVLQEPRQTPSTAAPAPRQLSAQRYQWRGDDQIAAIIDRDSTSESRAFDHDDRGRLIRERRVDQTIERGMDAAGNVFRTADGRDRRYGPGGRLEQDGEVRYQHDADGNQTARIEPDGRVWRFLWNGHGALREIVRPDGTRVQHDYDPFVRRTAKRTLGKDGSVERDTSFVWDGHVVVHELDGQGGQTTWHWEPDQPIPIAKEHDGRRWVIASDHLGTPSEMYDELGALVWRMQLDIFGVPRFLVGAGADCPWRWPGQYDDPETGTFYNRTRHYSPERGTYLSPDPAGLIASLNLYAYVSDPLTWIDLLALTGTYIFQFPGGELYIGKGPKKRALQSQSFRANQLSTTPSAIVQGAHRDFASDRMGLMVEAELMRRHGFPANPSLLNAKASPGQKLLLNATRGQRSAVTRNANALEQAFLKSTGQIC